MATLIKTTEEIQKYVSVDINLQQKSVLPYLHHGQQQIVRLLGKTLYNALNEHYNSEESESATLDALLPYVQRPLANFAVHYGLSALNVTIGPTGIGVINTQNIAPASQARTDALKQDLLDRAYDAMESLLEFLEENITDYPLWAASDAYAHQYSLLITSARRFDEKYRIQRSRLQFLEWIPTMRQIEALQIKPQIGHEMLGELKTQFKAGNMTDANEIIYEYLQNALANLTAGQKEKDEAARTVGINFLMSAKRYMDENIAEYPTYAASSVYSAAKPPYTAYTNDPDSNFIVI